jgi:tetrapyrrole methylase family protein/MazG family protein/ATP diphosphatase
MAHITTLLDIMARLRDPNGGCPWDVEQNFATIAPYTIEEAYEVAEAIAKGDMHELKDELGDLLLQVVFHAQMAAEAGSFTFADVVQSISEKMIRRHPHVFADADIKTADAQTANWEVIKEAERAAKKRERTLADVPAALPALMRAQKLQARAARVGFDWPDTRGVIDKIKEELAEVEAAIASGDKAHTEEELGDLLFAVTNLARFVGADAETSLRGTNAKFVRRFEFIEDALKEDGKHIKDASLDEMEALWNAAKKEEKQ